MDTNNIYLEIMLVDTISLDMTAMSICVLKMMLLALSELHGLELFVEHRTTKQPLLNILIMTLQLERLF